MRPLTLVLFLLVMSSVILGKLQPLSEPQFTHQ